MTADIAVHRTYAPIGARIEGLDLRRVDDDVFAVIHRAWLEHQVLLFPEQRLTDAELVTFSRRFGELEPDRLHATDRRSVASRPEIRVLSTVDETDPTGGGGDVDWHTDMSAEALPPRACIVSAVEVPPPGGEVSFCSMYDAWDRLLTELRVRLCRASLKHYGAYGNSGRVVHPLVCRHPDTGRPYLYLGRRRRASLEGLPFAESEQLLDRLWRATVKTARIWTHRWAPGDVVIWDSRCTIHRGHPFESGTRQILYRTQIRSQHPPVPWE